MFKGRNANAVSRKLHVSKVVDRLSIFREKSPVENFYIQKHKSKYGCESVSIVDDVYMLFNQQRLDRMTNAALADWLSRTSRTDSQLASLRSRMSDVQLGAFIKSRYIQSRSELLAYSSYLESQYPELAPAVVPESSPTPVPEPAPVPASASGSGSN
nr:unnamed protein product [uncultured bacterium]